MGVIISCTLLSSKLFTVVFETRLYDMHLYNKVLKFAILTKLTAKGQEIFFGMFLLCSLKKIWYKFSPNYVDTTRASIVWYIVQTCNFKILSSCHFNGHIEIETKVGSFTRQYKDFICQRANDRPRLFLIYLKCHNVS